MPLKLLVLLITLIYSVECYKILGLFPHFGKSHHDVYEPLLLELAKRGHELTIVSHFQPKKLPQGWTQISMGNFENYHKESVNLDIFEDRDGFGRFMHMKDSLVLVEFGRQMCEVLTNLYPIHKMIEERTQFDLVIIEQFASDCALGIAYVLNAPFIQIQSHTMMAWTSERFAQPSYPSYIPGLFLSLPSRMTFFQRLENFLFHLYYCSLYKYWIIPTEQEILHRNLNRTIPPLEEIAQNASALLSNTHYMLTGVKPLVPAIVQVAGMHLKQTVDPLSPELEKFMNDSKDGVILFSMGSMIRTTSIPKEKLKYIFEIFGKLKQRIIWKWEGERLPDQPDNMYIMKWVPQFDILHHPNTVAFISHGGMLGTLEGLHAGVPILFIPVFGDQNANAAVAEESGLGVSAPFKRLTKEMLENAVQKVLSQELRNSAKRLSAAWRDNPDPLEIATNLVEHVIRHGGERRKSPAQQLSLFQILSLDVISFLALIFIIIIFILLFAIKLLMKLVCGSRKKEKQS